MTRIVLVTGGARSGKSTFAEQLARDLGPNPVYIATAEAGDAEMAGRIAAHRARRSADWITWAEPLDIAQALEKTDGQAPRLVDCLTLWLSNLILNGHDWQDAAQGLCDTLERQSSPVVLVTNEVGMGIVPENALARNYRDAAGWMNQRVAAAAGEVWFTVSGCPMRVKPPYG